MTTRETTTLPDARSYETELRERLGLRDPMPPAWRLRGWILTGILALVAAILRLVNITHPHQLVFDETYYVKGGYSLITHGYERDWIGEGANTFFVQGSDVAASTAADYVVHPPLGKWLIGLGELIFGTNNGLGWRFSTAVAGIIAVALITRIALRLFHSLALAGLAGFFLAIDGVAIVMSRTGILDNHVMIFTLAGFWAVLKDRDWSRARLANAVAHGRFREDGSPAGPWGPRLWYRPWLLAAGLLLGWGCGVKWSVAYALAVFGITIWLWDTAARKEVGVRLWFGAGIFRGGIPAFVNFIPIALAGYVSTWTAWFLNDNSYKRGWAAREIEAGREVPFDFLPDAVAEWIAYHRQMMEFHTGLTNDHTYMSQPWAWIIQYRPVSFYWPPEEKLVQDCGAERCVQAITSLGNPILWWLAAFSLILVLFFAIRRRDWRAWAILAGYGAMYIPWFQYPERTIFQFYSVAFVPFVVLALTFGIAVLTRTLRPPRLLAVRTNPVDPEVDEDYFPELAEVAQTRTLDYGEDTWQLLPREKNARLTYLAISALLLIVSAFWYPIWIGMTVPYDFWHWHIWLPSWS